MTTIQLQDVVDALSRANCHPTRSGNGYTAFCPVHEADGNHKPSLTISPGNKQPVVLNCGAGCDYRDVFKALGIDAKASGKAGAKASGKRITAVYPYHDSGGRLVFEKVRFQPKDFRIRHRGDGGMEVWKLPPGTEPPLYRLPAVAAAIAAGSHVYLVEGEKDAERLAAAGLCATTNFDGAAAGTQRPKWRDSYTAALEGADVILLPDNDEPGRAHMRHAAAALEGKARRVRWLELPGLPAKGDVSDWLDAGHTVDEFKALAAGANAFESLVEDATGTPADEPHQTPAAGDNDEVDRLAALSPIDYDRQRGTAAKALGIRADTLDKLVKEARGEPATGNGNGGKALEFPDVEPWPHPVDGELLLNALVDSVKQYLSLPDHAAPAIALWTLNSWVVVEHGHVAPILAVTSPEKRCGKSTLLDWLSRLADKPLPASNITAAAIFRTVDSCSPTLLIDEADSFLGETGDELRGILNSGHTRASAFVIRVCGEDNEPRKFSTWGAKVVALIGKLQGRYSTLHDRAIEVQLRRKLPTEKLAKLRHADETHFETLARQCRRFALDNGLALGKARPDIPDTLHDRAADNWEGLLAIADAAGGTWPRLARTVAVALSGGADTDTTAGDSLGVQLLADLRRYFDSGTASSYSTEMLLNYLCGIAEAPWPGYAKGKAMTARHLAKLLHPYKILPRSVRLSATDTPKGYHVADFQDAFARYLPFIRHTATSQSTSGESPYSVSDTEPGCCGYEQPGLASPQAGCVAVADKAPGTVAAGAAATVGDEADWF